MRNFINYYYNFNITDIHFNNGKYFFYNEKDRYMLKTYYGYDLKVYYYELSHQLEHYDYFFSVVLNKDNNYVTWIENKPYILLKLTNISNDKISIFDIRTDLFITYDTKYSVLNRFPWFKLWESKIDYFEEFVFSKYDNYKKIFPLFHYFIGIAENALLYLKEVELEEKKEFSDQLVIAHDRVDLNYELYDYYDPTNIIIDHASRDLSEYVKSMFINKVWDLDLIKKYLEKHSFSKYGIRILFARILFPSFFFDYFEAMIVNNNIDLLYLENRADEFENFITEVSLFFKDNYNIPIIPWIIKKI